MISNEFIFQALNNCFAPGSQSTILNGIFENQKRSVGTELDRIIDQRDRDHSRIASRRRRSSSPTANRQSWPAKPASSLYDSDDVGMEDVVDQCTYNFRAI